MLIVLSYKRVQGYIQGTRTHGFETMLKKRYNESESVHFPHFPWQDTYEISRNSPKIFRFFHEKKP